jgi:hypothetical protein
VDFLLHLGDGCPAGLPLVQSNINRSNEQAGFTIPMHMWKEALGPEQFTVLAECLQVGVHAAGVVHWRECLACLQCKFTSSWAAHTAV